MFSKRLGMGSTMTLQDCTGLDTLLIATTRVPCPLRPSTPRDEFGRAME